MNHVSVTHLPPYVNSRFFFSFKRAVGEVGRSELGELHSSLLVKESVYLPAKKGEHIFILGKKTSRFQRKMTATIPVESF